MLNKGLDEHAARVIVAFGPFAVDTQNNELQKHGIRLKIAPQALRVLFCLIDQSPKVVSRDTLFQILWPGDTHVDFEGNLNAIVRDLREALGDSARNPRYIETEPRRGYRFIADVKTIEIEHERPPAKEPLSAPANLPHHRRGRFTWSLMGGTAAIAIAAVALLSHGRSGAALDSEPLRMVPLTSVSSRAGHATFSPDGSKIAFHWDGDPKTGFDIYIGTVGSDHFEHFTRDPSDDLYPAWSPDGHNIAFLRCFPDRRCAVYVAAADGSGERLIKWIPTESTVSWSPDGHWLTYTVQFFGASEASSSSFGVYALSLLSGQVKRLSEPGQGWLGDLDGTFSPDGKRVAFFRSLTIGMNQLFVQDLDPGMNRVGLPHLVTREAQNARSPVWTPDGKAIIYSSLAGDVRGLWQVPADGSGKPSFIGGEDASEPAIDKNGRIIYERAIVHDNLLTVRLCATGQLCPDAVPQSLIYQRMLARNPDWSPDARRVAFESLHGARVQVWISDRDGSNAFELTSFRSPSNGTPRWSPDGRFIAADSRDTGHSKLYLVDVQNRTQKRLTTGDWEDVTPSFSHDGRTIYFASNRTGRYEVWKLALASGTMTQVTRHGGFYAQETSDGKTLVYARGMTNTQLGTVSVAGGDEKILINSLDYWPDFAVVSGGVYFMQAHQQRGNLMVSFRRFADGVETSVATIPGINAQGLTISKDGRELLVSVRSSVDTNLIALERPNQRN